MLIFSSIPSLTPRTPLPMKRLLFTLSGVLLVATHPAHSALLLNEVHLNPPNGTGLGDRNYEYIELRSTTGVSESTNGVTLIIVNNDRWDFKTNTSGQEVATKLNLGGVEEIWSLDEMKTGTNGLLLLGDKYTELPKGGPWSGFIDPATEVGDPVGMGDGNISPHDGLSIFLVSGYTNPAPNGGTVEEPVVDFDVDDNGVLDWLQNPKPPTGLQSAPWTAILDQIGTRDRNVDAWPTAPVPAGVTGVAEPYTGLANGVSANLNAFFMASPPTWSIGDRDPDSFSRNASLLTASSANAWYGGKYPDPLPGTDPANSIPYRTTRVFGLSNGLATPGRVNLSTAPPAADFRINEVNLDSSNDRYQYIEIVNTNSPTPGSRSLNGYWLVMVDSNVSESDITNGVANKVGAIEEEWDLSAMATGTDGLLIIADGSGSSYTPFEDYVPATTGKGDPVAATANPRASGFGIGDIGSKSGFSLFLIRGYKSGTDAALAPDRDLDTNEDGILDANAFASAANAANVTVVDSIGFDMAAPQPGGAGKTYASVNLRTVFPEFTATDGNKASDNFSRKVSGGIPVNTNVTGSWYGGEYPSSAGFNLGFQPPQTDQITANNPTGVTHFGGFRGAATPGRPNLEGPINSAAPPIPADIRISEVMFDPTDTAVSPDPDNHDLDQNRDYIELLSTNRGLAYLDGYWILVVDNGAVNKGRLQTGAPLDGQTTGLNGLLLLGDNYDTTISIPYISVEGLVPPSTATVDPVVAFGGDDIPGKGASILLIRGPAFDLTTTPNGPFKTGGPITLGANLKPSGDIDPDNDGVLLPSADWLAPGATLVDAISTGSIDPGPEYGYISSGSWIPDCATRISEDYRASTPAAWHFGEVDQTANPVQPSTAFTNFVGPFRGNASPGRWNHVAEVGSTAAGSVLINEIHFNPAGGDGNFEFIEILDRNGASRSLNSYSLLMIDNVKNNTGTVQRVWNLDGLKTGTNGLCVITNATAATSPWSSSFRPQTVVSDLPGRDDLLSGFGDATIATESDNQSVMMLLVRNFNSYLSADLDDFTGVNVESPGDGIFDNAFAAWDGGIVHDSVILRSWLPAEVGPPAVPAQWNGFTYSLSDVSGFYFPSPNALFYHPETIARFRGNITPNSGSAWYAGDLVGGPSGKLGTDTTYVTNDPTHPPMPPGFLGRTTPGQLNLAPNESADPDGDGVNTLLEEAFVTDPFNRDATSPLPVVGTVNDGGQNYAAITFNRIKGGTTSANKVYAAEAFTYTVETSTDLQSWSADGTTIVQSGTVSSNPDGITESVTFRLNAPLTDPAGRRYLRLRVGRQ
jgi:hypothetical protein